MKEAVNGCCQTLGWIGTFGLWGSIFMYYFAAKNPNTDLITLILFGIVVCIAVIIYLFVHFISPICFYLRETRKAVDIYPLMQHIFYTRPVIKMGIQCYHNEMKKHTTKDKDGKTSTWEREEEVRTKSAQEEFRYASWKDVSGTWVFDTQFARGRADVPYVSLQLSLEVCFAQDGTSQVYDTEKENFIKRNLTDEKYYYSKDTSVEGMVYSKMVRLSDSQPRFFGLIWYVIFTLLGVVDFYTAYIAPYCLEQSFNVVKMVSCNEDLNKAELREQDAHTIPTLRYNDKVRVFNKPSKSPYEGPIPVAEPIIEEREPGKNNYERLGLLK